MFFQKTKITGVDGAYRSITTSSIKKIHRGFSEIWTDGRTHTDDSKIPLQNEPKWNNMVWWHTCTAWVHHSSAFQWWSIVYNYNGKRPTHWPLAVLWWAGDTDRSHNATYRNHCSRQWQSWQWEIWQGEIPYKVGFGLITLSVNNVNHLPKLNLAINFWQYKDRTHTIIRVNTTCLFLFLVLNSTVFKSDALPLNWGTKQH